MSDCGHPPSNIRKRCECGKVADRLRSNFCTFCSKEEKLIIYCIECSEPPKKCRHQPESFRRKCKSCEEDEMPLRGKCCTDCGTKTVFEVFCVLCQTDTPHAGNPEASGRVKKMPHTSDYEECSVEETPNTGDRVQGRLVEETPNTGERDQGRPVEETPNTGDRDQRRPVEETPNTGHREEGRPVVETPNTGDRDQGHLVEETPNTGDRDQRRPVEETPNTGHREEGRPVVETPNTGDRVQGRLVEETPNTGDRVQGRLVEETPNTGDRVQGRLVEETPNTGDRVQGRLVEETPNTCHRDQRRRVEETPNTGDFEEGRLVEETPNTGHRDQRRRVEETPNTGDRDQRRPVEETPNTGDRVQGRPVEETPNTGDRDQRRRVEETPNTGDFEEGRPVEETPNTGDREKGCPVRERVIIIKFRCAVQNRQTKVGSSEDETKLFIMIHFKKSTPTSLTQQIASIDESSSFRHLCFTASFPKDTKEVSYWYELEKQRSPSQVVKVNVQPGEVQLQIDGLIFATGSYKKQPNAEKEARNLAFTESTFLELRERADQKMPVAPVLLEVSRPQNQQMVHIASVGLKVIEKILENPTDFGFAARDDKTAPHWHNNLRLIKLADHCGAVRAYLAEAPASTSSLEKLISMSLPPTSLEEIQALPDNELSEVSKSVQKIMDQLLDKNRPDLALQLVPAYHLVVLAADPRSRQHILKDQKWDESKPNAWFGLASKFQYHSRGSGSVDWSRLKKFQTISIDFNALMELLNRFGSVDSLLNRFCAGVVKQSNLEAFLKAPNVTLDSKLALCFRVCQEMGSSDDERVLGIVEMFLDECQDAACSASTATLDLEELLLIFPSLVKLLLRTHKSMAPLQLQSMCFASLNTYLRCLLKLRYSQSTGVEASSKDEISKFGDLLNQLIKHEVDTLKQKSSIDVEYSHEIISMFLQHFDKFMELLSTAGCPTEELVDLCKQNLKSFIKKLPGEATMEIFQSEGIMALLSSKTSETILEVVIQNLKQKTKSYFWTAVDGVGNLLASFFGASSDSSSSHIFSELSSLIEDTEKGDWNRPWDISLHTAMTLEWPLAQQLLCFLDPKAAEVQLTTNARTALEKCRHDTETLLRDLETEPLSKTVGAIQYLARHKASLKKAANVLRLSSDVDKQIDGAQEWKAAYDNTVKKLKELHALLQKTLCSNIVEIEGFRKKLLEAEVRECKIKELVDTEFCLNRLHLARFPELQPFLNHLETAVLPKIHRINQSSTFESIFAEVAGCKFRSGGEIKLPISKLIPCLLEAIDEWEAKIERLKSEEATWEAAQFLKSLFDREEELVKELSYLATEGEPWVEKLAEKLNRAQKILRFSTAAAAVQKSMEKLKIPCKDDILVRVQKTASGIESEALAKVNTDDIDEFIFLKEFAESPVFEQLMAAVSSSSELIEWLPQNIQNGPQLKTFQDLAMIYLGDSGDLEQKKIEVLVQVVNDFQEIIYGIEALVSNEERRVTEFLELCRPVMERLQKEPKRIEDLTKTANQLKWIKIIKENQGSVERPTLEKIEEIFKSGSFQIGCLVENTDHFLLTTTKESKADDSPKTQSRAEFTLADVKDLQSKLMLIAGSAYENKLLLDSFVKLTEGILRLVEVYKDFRAHCCLLCEQIDIVVDLGSAKAAKDRSTEAGIKKVKKDHNINIELRYCKPHKSIGCHYSDINEGLTQLSNVFHSCLVKWKEVITSSRTNRDLHEINFFTLKQLKFLQNELAKFFTSAAQSQVDDRVLHLLSYICPACTPKEICKAVDFVVIKKAGGDSDANEENSGHKAAVSLLTDEGYNEEVIDKTLKIFFRNFTVEEDNWSQNLIELAEKVEKTSVVQAEESSRKDWSTADHELSAAEVGGLPVHEAFEKLWEIYQRSIDKSHKDFLSFHDLSMVLRRLSENEKSPISKRKLKPEFQKLFSCSEPITFVINYKDQLLATLDLFRSAYDSLPQLEEVLVCSDQTTEEDVSVFMHRSVLDQNSQALYVIMGAEQLSYQNSVFAEDIFSRLLDLVEGRTKAKIFALMADDQQRNFPFCSILASFIQDYPIIPNEKDIRDWTAKFLREQTPEESSFVWVTSSHQASGMGKSLMCSQIAKKRAPDQDPAIFSCNDTHLDAEKLHEFLSSPLNGGSAVFHIDIAREVQTGFDVCITQIAILGGISSSAGFIWRRGFSQRLLLLEHSKNLHFNTDFRVLNFLPCIQCRSPSEILEAIADGKSDNAWEPLLKDELLTSDSIRKPVKYLLNKKDRRTVQLSAKDVVKLLVENCGIENPSWQELQVFSRFFCRQISDMEKSPYCLEIAGSEIQGFQEFVLKFMLIMSKDFATRSLSISDESGGSQISDGKFTDSPEKEDLQNFQLRRRWEQNSHPYLLFNEDGATFTFVGFTINPAGDLLDQKRAVIQKGIMSQQLYKGLHRQGVHLDEAFDSLPRDEMINKIRMVFGFDNRAASTDPDLSYELTTDNAMKMLAIYMRFRCEIPVVLMGETGCGKTKLVEFLSKLMLPEGHPPLSNIRILKVHGGVSEAEVVSTLREAEKLAAENFSKSNRSPYTIVFFDEVNTTSAVGLIKEVMIDGRAHGKPIDFSKGLRCVAACNPYRKHSEETIKILENSGLGYRVRKEQTSDRFGTVPMRHLVYRVKPLPLSFLQVLWDFGNLTDESERKYIDRIIESRKTAFSEPAASEKELNILKNAIAASQRFMRTSSDEAKFVSLRDVEKAMKMLEWLYRSEIIDTNSKESKKCNLTKFISAAVISLAVCYYSRLPKNRQHEYLSIIKQVACTDSVTEGDISDFISAVQSNLVSDVQLPESIAMNEALRENIFTMVVCISLRIPLFIVGKPGSSKSLGKAIVKELMQGQNSQGQHFKKLPNTQMLSFQCSPWSTSEGIISTFTQAAKLQVGRDENEFASVVVLDEIGLAEDSQNMPLKALHSLLEEGVSLRHQMNSEVHDQQANTMTGQTQYVRVSFVGLSNWALDPAKMNRGLYILRGVPAHDDLIETAKGICKDKKQNIVSCLDLITRFYFKICDETCKQVEFFGLRDYFCLVKHLVFKTKGKKVNNRIILECLLRNFSGFKDLNPTTLLDRKLESVDLTELQGYSPILDSLRKSDDEQRYLLFITQNMSGFKVLLKLLDRQMSEVGILYASSFPKDQEYSKMCTDINKIKVSMERGGTLVLLNIENLYESLYDALNQYYEYCGQDRFVDLGLGTHRLKCKVHKEFRIIVIADQSTVEEKFPIPLINRLEKHKLSTEAILNDEKRYTIRQILEWVEKMKTSGEQGLQDIFVGYHSDVVPSLVFELEKVESVKEMLLSVVTVESLVQLDRTDLSNEKEELLQNHCRTKGLLSLRAFLTNFEFKNEKPLLQVTTYDRLMSIKQVKEFSRNFPEKLGSFEHCYLSKFESETQFCEHLRVFFKHEKRCTLLLQCEGASSNYQSLISCVKYLIEENIKSGKQGESLPDWRVILIIKLLRSQMVPFTGLEGGLWNSVHIEELVSSNRVNIHHLDGLPMSKVVSKSSEIEEPACMSETGMSEKPVNFGLLLRNCQYAALSRLKDPTSSDKRLGNRLQTLQQVLSEPKFLSKANDVVSESLRWKEDSWQATFTPSQWLSFESAKLINVRNAGNLTESAWRTIKREASHAFACFLAFTDRDGNLKNYSNELKALWLDLLGCAFFCDIEFKRSCEDKMRAPVESAEFEVTSSAADNHDFDSQFPFSWAVLERMRRLMEVDPDRLVELFGESDFGEILKKHDFDDALLLKYSQDMLNMLLLETDSESVTQVSRILVQSPDIQKDSLPNALSSCLLVLQRFKQQVQLLLKLKSQIKDLTLNIAEVQRLEDLPDVLFTSFYKHFEKNKTHLNSAENRKLWQAWVTDSDAVICRLLLKNGNEEMQLQWDRIQCVFIFLTEVVNAFDSEAHIEESDIKPIQLWNSLQRKLKENFQSLEAIRIIEEFVDKMNTSLTEKILGSKDCSKCKKRSDFKLILPCADRLCAECVADCEVSENHADSRKCPICKQDFDPKAVSGPKQQVLVDFKARCTRFMMQVVSKLCFQAAKPPTEDLCHHLIGFVTRTSKQNAAFGLFGDDRDDSPVFRSFILQRLLKFQPSQVESLLQQHVDAVANFRADARHDLAKIIVNCMEDAQIVRSEAEAMNEEQQLHHAVSLLAESTLPEKLQLLQIPHLQNVASRRVALRVLAFAFSLGNLGEETVNALARALEPHKWSRIYFLRCLSMEVGVSAAIGLIFRNTVVKTTLEAEIGGMDVVPVPDFLLSHSEAYKDSKEYVLSTLYDSKTQDSVLPDSSGTILVLAALASTYKLRHMTEEKPPEFENCIERLKSELSAPQKKLYNQLAYLTQSPLPDHNAALLCIRLAYVLHANSTNESSAFRKFLKDLKSLADNSYLPAMMHDEIWERLLEMTHCPITTKDRRGSLRDKNFKMYCCPNGHPYVLGECTQGWVKYKCPECAADIGGQKHKIAANNTEYTCKTKMGFSPPSMREGQQPLRKLTPASAALIRLLQHLAMLVSPDSRRKLQTPDANCYLRGFVDDLKLFSQVTGRSEEETYHILHLLLKQLESAKSESVSFDLKTDKSRREFEDRIDRELIQPIMGNLSDLLQKSNKEIAQQTSEILQIIHGTSKMEEEEEASLWKCHKRITVKHAEYAFQELSTELSERYRLTGTVINWLPVLRHVGSLPRLMRLTKELTTCYNYKITSKDASSRSFQEAWHDRSDECKQDVYEFGRIWDELKHRLKLARFEDLPYPVVKGEVSACDLPLAALLPHSSEWGSCIVALVQLLVDAQNAVIDASAIKTEKISLDDIDQAAVIPRDLEAGLLPILLANSSYSLKDAACVEYDFKSLECQLVDFLARGRCRIAPLLSPIVYKDEVHLMQLFKRLERTVPQNSAPSSVPLTQALSSNLPHELRDITELLDDSLPAAMRFLISLAPKDTQELLHAFMTERLAMPGLPTPQLQRSVTLADTKLLWMFLDHLRCRCLIRSDLNPFEDCGEVIELPMELPKELKNRRSILMEKLHAFIRLELSSGPAIYEGMELQEVCDIFPEYDEFSAFDGSFLCEHAVAVWTALNRME